MPCGVSPGWFTFRKFIHYVSHESGIEVDEVTVGEVMFAGIYKLTFPFVSKLAELFGEDNMTLLTFGDREFQEAKIQASGLVSLFDKIIYTEEDKEGFIRKFCILNKGHRVVFIDDTFRHFILEKPPANLTQICVNATGKLTEEQKTKLKTAGITIEVDRSKIVGHVRKIENRELKRLK